MTKPIIIDNLLSSPAAKQSFIKPAHAETVGYRKAAKTTSRKLSNTSELNVLALSDMSAFAQLINFHGGWDNFGECHKELVGFITKPQTDKELQQKLKFTGDDLGLRRLVLMSRGHLKSTINTVLYTMWRLYRNPNIRILVGSNKQTLSHSFIRELRSYFENPELDHVWNQRPHIEGALLPTLDKKNRDRNTNIDTEAVDRKVIWNNVALQVIRPGKFKEPSVFAASVGATVTGQHYDLVILDDVVDFDNVESEPRKARVEEWIADLESVLNPPQFTTIEGREGFSLPEILGGELVVSGTRYAVDDYYGQILEKPEELGFVTHVRNVYKNGQDDSEGYLWHERYTRPMIERLQARMSPRRFSSQYLNRVYEKDIALFNTSAIQKLASDAIFSNNKRTCVRLPNGRVDVLNAIIAVDPAFSTSKTSDDCAILVGGKLHDGRLVVLDASLERMEAAEVVAKVIEFAKKYQTLRLFFEQNGVGLLLPELFKHEAALVDGKRLVCVGHYEQRTKESKIQGVLEIPINSGQLVLSSSVYDNAHIWKQLVNFPAVRHDDFLDGLVTLFEKSVASRESFQSMVSEVNLQPYQLNVDSLVDRTTDSQTYLEQFNSYYK